MKRFGLDLDGVCYNFCATASYLLNTRFGYKLPSEWPYWSWQENGICKEHWDWLWDEGIRLGLFRHGHCFKGTFDAVRAIQARGYEVAIVTTRPQEAAEDTMDWLLFHGLPTTEVYILGYGKKKSSIPACDVYLDDYMENVKDLRQNTAGKVLLMSRLYNEFQEPPDGVIRVASWEEVLEHV